MQHFLFSNLVKRKAPEGAVLLLFLVTKYNYFVTAYAANAIFAFAIIKFLRVNPA